MRKLSLREWRHFQGHTASWWQAHCIQVFQSPEAGSEILSTALVHVIVTWGLVEATESHSQRFWFWSVKPGMRLRSLHIKSPPLQVILTQTVCGSHFRSSTGSLQRLPGSALWPTAYFKDDSSNITHARCFLVTIPQGGGIYFSVVLHPLGLVSASTNRTQIWCCARHGCYP